MEALAAASSVLAVVSLALQLADNVQRLIDFWDSVKDAPTEITEIRSQLRILGALFSSIEPEASHTSIDDGNSMGNDCLLVCKESIAKLEKLKEWDLELNRNGVRRKWVCLRKALREKELARYWSELERAKSTLIMYQCLKNEQRQDSLYRILEKMIPGPHTEKCQQSLVTRSAELDTSRIIDRRFKKIHLGTTTYELHLSFGTIRVRFVKESVIDKSTHKDNTNSLSHLKIVATFLPKITSWRILEFSFNQRYKAIDAGLQSFNLRPAWSPIFRYASRGDLEAVRRLLEDGLASPNDVDPDGWTILHCAAAAHQTSMCQMLLALGAASDPVTKRQETPLLLATQSNERNMYRLHFHPRDNESASLDTVRVLVEQGKNDPMQSGDIGETSIFTASRMHTSESLRWLMNQDEYEMDLNYATPRGMTAAALIAQREDLSARLFEPLLRSGIAVDAPCARWWLFQLGYWFIAFKDPSMIQYAVWSWYDKLLNSYGQPAAQPVSLPMATIQTLLAHGASLHSGGSTLHTLLDGLVLNIIQSMGEDRPPEALASAMSIWLGLVQQLGFSLKDYLRTEAARQIGKAYDLGLGIRMKVFFNEVTAPHIWTRFQGPQEREKYESVDRISKCALWKVWKDRYAVPTRIPKPKVYKVWQQSAEIILVKQCGCSSLDAQAKCCECSSEEVENAAELPQTTQNLRGLLISMNPSRKRRAVSSVLSLVISARHYRHEFTFYVFILACFFGCSYLARLWIAGGFFLAFKLLQGTVSYWV